MTPNESITRDYKIRKSIIASVIASVIIIILIQPLLRLVWSLVLGQGSRFIQAYVDSIYQSAALGHRNHVDVMMLSLFVGVISGAFTGISLVFTLAITKGILRPDRKPQKLAKRSLLLLWLGILLLLVFAIALIIMPFADLQYNTSFQQRLKVLAPRITELEAKELEAAWASMQSRADYEAIKAKMEDMAQQYDISLPPTLLK